MSHVTGFAGALLAEYRLETGCDPLEDRKAYEEWLLRWTTRNEKAKWKALFKKYGTNVEAWPDNWSIK